MCIDKNVAEQKISGCLPVANFIYTAETSQIAVSGSRELKAVEER